MASINKLSIRGIRAFSPEDSEQVVEFYFPCTIIVGANGCGKTTIIESLKYAVTGGFPPGAKSGQAFVHDARSIGQSTVKANVKLRFTSRSGQSMVVVRSMELTQKKAKSTFKQLDGVLRTIDPDTGERVSLSHKCSELDKQIPQLLGVSAPILEHVIFCHQEDSSWPLQEGAVLKKRFDDIFDSTRYSKALDIFRKTEKEMLSQVKDLKADLAGLKSHKYAAEGFRKELAEQTEQIESVDEMKQEIGTKVTKAEEDIKRNQEIIAAVEDVDNEIESKKNEVAQEHMLIKKQKIMLEEDLTTKHSLQDLKYMLRDFDDKVTAVVDKKEELEKKVRQIQQEIQEMRNEELQLTGRIGKFAAEKEAHEKRLRERYNKMESIAMAYNIDLNLTQLSQGTASSQQMPSQSYGDDNNTHNRLENINAADSASVLTISTSDMTSFFNTLEKKEVELKENLKLLRDRYQAEEDSIQVFLTEYGGKLKSIENDRSKLADEKNDITRENNELASQSSGPRLRKNDVDDAQKRAAEAVKKLERANSEARETDIPAKIRNYERRIDEIKRQLEDERITLEGLRHSADAQHEMSVLKEQCEKDLEALEDSLREQNYTINKYNVKGMPVGNIRMNDDDDGTQLSDAVGVILTSARSKYDDVNSKLSKASSDVSKTQRIVSEKKAVLTSSQKTLLSHRSRLQALNQSVEDVKKTVEELRRHEAVLGLTLTPTVETPKELLDYVDGRLEELEDDAPDMNAPSVARKLMKRLKKMLKVHTDDDHGFSLVCPCCKREMHNETEVAAFTKAVNELLDNPDFIKSNTAEEEAYKNSKSNYQRFRKLLSDKMEDLRDHRRMSDESAEIEKEARKLEGDVALFEATLQDQKEKEIEIQAEVDELREFVDIARRWSEDATRISEKRMQISQKNMDLTLSVADNRRDLRTVERDMNSLMEEKDNLTNSINRLNKEMTQLNNSITQFSIQSSQLEKLYRDKETKYASELKASERKAVLVERMKQIGDEERKMQEQIGPLKTKIRAKEGEKQRIRAMCSEEEQKLQHEVTSFDSDVKHLRELVLQIDAYLESSKPDELERLSSTISKLLARIDDRKQRHSELQPELESARNAVLDQERHKKNLKQNIDIVESKIRMKELDKDISRLQQQRDSIEGHETAYDDYASARSSKEKFQEDKARLDGRFSEIAESIRSLKRKLSTPEYKNVDEEYRIATIKHTTTQIAADDLKKYATALDKALLQFHSVKIGEINKIIRELWLLTYKGEDINNIEIVSGQEPGSRAAKSYNYRVVMTKGSTEMDMRGRCSAGQRVLASVVIRLALAETFGISCGCIALDEPTVNLDFNNKKGLAIALAQIVASRSQQRNFQLILITHDEEFVIMMKTELSSLTGFSMPDRYFQVRREQAADGKFYSKINSIDWDELV